MTYDKDGVLNLKVAETKLEMVRPALCSITRVLLRTFTGNISAIGISRILDFTLLHIPNHVEALAMLANVVSRYQRALFTHRAWERVCWFATTVCNAPDAGPDVLSVGVPVILQSLRRVTRAMLHALVQQVLV
tara:strand:- start:40 stop:438 length:399 start_codon:yes stop_codon:yes gene_type:complete